MDRLEFEMQNKIIAEQEELIDRYRKALEEIASDPKGFQAWVTIATTALKGGEDVLV